MPRKRQIPRGQDAWVIAQQLRTWSRRQWKVAGWSYLGALLVMGTAGETLPGAQAGRVVPVFVVTNSLRLRRFRPALPVG